MFFLNILFTIDAILHFAQLSVIRSLSDHIWGDL